tara:strand:+ start:7274 stop:8143 length:870 start_codon:yes stop_codon:yes gene_type:complete
MEKNIENIIRSKRFIELTDQERELIKEWAASEEEFDQLKHVFIATDVFNTEQEETLNPTIKQRLDVRFKDKYDQRRLVWYNKLWLFLWPEDTTIVRKPLVQLAAIGLITIMVTPFLFQNDTQNRHVASNEKTPQEERLIEEKEAEVQGDLKEDGDQLKANVVDEENEQTQKSPAESLQTRSNDQFSGTKDAEQQNKADKVMDAAPTPDGGWVLNDEVAEAEEPALEEVVVTESMTDRKLSNEMDENQSVYAGSIAMDMDDSEMELSKGYASSAKKVSAEKTLDLISALY